MHNSIFTLIDQNGFVIFDQKKVQIREFDLEDKVLLFSFLVKNEECTKKLFVWILTYIIIDSDKVLQLNPNFIVSDGILQCVDEWKIFDVRPQVIDFGYLEYTSSSEFDLSLMVTFSEYEKR